MSVNTSFAGTAHIRAIANSVLVRKSITIQLSSKADCLRLRAQFNNLRFQDREFNKKRHPFNHPQYGVSDFDVIETKLEGKDSLWFLTLRTVESTLEHMVITDEEGNIIKPEDL